MFEAVPSPYLVSADAPLRVADAPSGPPDGAPSSKECRKQLEDCTERIDDLQRRLYADDRVALLLIFQAMDAAGKDGTIRAVMSGVNPAGCQTFSFKKPTPEELDHDFLWRSTRRLPERGRIGIFNRSYYEEVLVVRVHPAFLAYQRLPGSTPGQELWRQRFESIRDHEKHLARNGTLVLKFWLNVSREEQRRRFLARIDEPDKNWKFSSGDVRERAHWEHYMQAYEEALNATSRSWAPWYAIPADDKRYMRLSVAEIIADNLERLGLRYPEVDSDKLVELKRMRSVLEGDGA